jgi:hypothetical protein
MKPLSGARRGRFRIALRVVGAPAQRMPRSLGGDA